MPLPHLARVCMQFLDNEGIACCSHSPDMNPIATLLDLMHQGIQHHQVAPQTVKVLSDTDPLDTGLGGDPPGQHPPSHQEHVQTLLGVHTGMWGHTHY